MAAAVWSRCCSVDLEIQKKTGTKPLDFHPFDPTPLIPPLLQRAAIRRRFLSACKVLGLKRLQTLTIHHARHTFVSHALAGGRTLAEVRGAAGHTTR